MILFIPALRLYLFILYIRAYNRISKININLVSLCFMLLFNLILTSGFQLIKQLKSVSGKTLWLRALLLYYTIIIQSDAAQRIPDSYKDI